VQAQPVPASKNSGLKGSEVLCSSVARTFSSVEFSPTRLTRHAMLFDLLPLQFLQNKKSITYGLAFGGVKMRIIAVTKGRGGDKRGEIPSAPTWNGLFSREMPSGNRYHLPNRKQVFIQLLMPENLPHQLFFLIGIRCKPTLHFVDDALVFADHR
jgi:hypothetical protein